MATDSCTPYLIRLSSPHGTEPVPAYSVERYYPQVKANALIGLAGVSRTQNNWDQTISYHRESIDILGTIGAKCDLAEAYFQFGLTYQAMRKPDQAEECKAEALKIFQNIKAPKQCDRVNKAFEQRAIK